MNTSVAAVKTENNDRMTACLDEYGVFFAFGSDQLEKGVSGLNLKDGEKVANLGNGMFCKATVVDDFIAEFEKVCQANKDALIQKAGIDALIRYELSNHECYYTGSTADAVDALAEYDITDQAHIQKIFAEEWANRDD